MVIHLERRGIVLAIGISVAVTGLLGLTLPNLASATTPPQWSMYGRDSAHTGRSPASGPTTAHLAWKVNLPASAQDNASPVVGPDGSVYMPTEQGLYAINPNGTLKWTKWADPYDYTLTRQAAAVASDGTVYVWRSTITGGGRLYALNPLDGSTLWSVSVGDASYGSPTISPGGTIYIGNWNGNLYAFNPNGTRKWVWRSGSNCAIESSPALATDGTIYVQHNCRGLVALRSTGTLKWTRNVGEPWNSPSVGAGGTIYIGSGDYYFYAYRPDGTRKWRVKVRAWMYHSSSAIGARGATIYRGDNSGNFYAISSTGHILWRYQPTDHGPIFSAPALSANGLVYYTQEVSKSGDASLYALRASTGKVVWKYRIGRSDASPALASNGTLYVAGPDPTRSGKATVYAFR